MAEHERRDGSRSRDRIRGGDRDEKTGLDRFPSPDDGVDEPERTLWAGGFSAKSMFGSWAAAVATTLVVVLVVMLIEDLRGNNFARIGAVAIVAVVWLYLVCVWLFRRWGMHYEVTTQRIKHREGILFRKLDRIELIDVDDVHYRQGPVQAMLGVGNICIRSSDTSHPELTMYGIANIAEIADMIDDARRSERRKRGLHIESI